MPQTPRFHHHMQESTEEPDGSDGSGIATANLANELPCILKPNAAKA